MGSERQAKELYKKISTEIENENQQKRNSSKKQKNKQKNDRFIEGNEYDIHEIQIEDY